MTRGHDSGAGMDTYLDDESSIEEHPIDIAEAVLGQDGRLVTERSDDGDLSFTCTGAFCPVTGFLGWREELPAVLLTVSFDLVAPPPRMHGRIRGRTFLLERETGWDGWRFEDGRVCLFVRAADHTVERWFAFGPSDATGHIVDMHTYHTMRILLASVLRMDRVHQVNVHAAAAET